MRWTSAGLKNESFSVVIQSSGTRAVGFGLFNGNGTANLFSLGKTAEDLLIITEAGKSVTVGPTFNRVAINGNNRINVADAEAFQRDPVNIIRLFWMADHHGLPLHPDALRAVTL